MLGIGVDGDESTMYDVPSCAADGEDGELVVAVVLF